MTGLRQFFEDATEAPPPSRLLADEVYTAGRRRLRRRRTVGASALAVAVCALAGVAVVTVPDPGPGPAPDDRAATAAPPVTPGPLPQPGLIQWAGAADAQHLYLALTTCRDHWTCKARWQLVGSDDGGQTWTVRGNPGNLVGARVLGPDLLLSTSPDPAAGADRTKLVSSRDGGRSWQDTRTGPEVPAAPSGSSAVCQTDPDLDPAGILVQGWQPCEVHAFDPASNQVSRLAEQPPLVVIDEQWISASGDRFWAPGFDRATRRPAIAMSPDRGRTWSSHVFGDEPACTADRCAFPTLTVGSGPVAYALIETDRTRVVYRHTADRGWQRSAGAGQVLDGSSSTGSFVTPDGSHVLYQHIGLPGDVEEWAYRFWVARGGEDTYRPVEMEGLPAKAGEVRRAPDGWLYTPGDDHVAYGSTDGRHWVPLNRR